MSWWNRERKPDAELETFRNIMTVPTHFEDGFSLSSLVGTLFIALIMVPGALYMELVAGMGIGGVASWVTVLLFVEIAKRANARLSRPQIFILFYLSGMIGSSATSSLLFTQFLVRSDAATSYGISSLIPNWVAPANLAELPHTFLQKAWMPAVGLMLFRSLFGQFSSMVLGYGLFRVTNDIERLPFPLAPMSALAVVAVAEQVEGAVRTSIANARWRMFCIGAGIGMIFGLVFMALPTLTGAFFGTPLMVFPIPWADFTPFTQRILPAVATGISFDLGGLITGMILPFYSVLGGVVSMLVYFVANPILYHTGQLPTWRPGDGTVQTLFANNVDFYFSVGLGLQLALAGYGLLTIVRSVRASRVAHQEAAPAPKERGDMPNKLIIYTYFVTVLAYILVSGYLIDFDPRVMLVLVFFGFLYTPVISYVTAKLIGMVGQSIEIPFIQELAFILCGYKGVAIWFLPIPRANYGGMVGSYKNAELLGCKFGSVWKSTFILFPIIFIAMLAFSSFIWGMGDVPSAVYPFTQQMWELNAKNACLVYSSTTGEYSPFQEALNGFKVLLGLGLGTGLIALCDVFAAPAMFLFGVVGSLGQAMPHFIIPSFIGALLGKYYFEKRYGQEWRKVIPLLGAGFGVGLGLITMLAIGLVFLSKTVSTVSY